MDSVPEVSTTSIVYAIPETEWRKAIEQRRRPYVDPLCDFFYGDVQFVVSGESLFERGMNLSIADLAVGIADIFKDGFPEEKDEAAFQQLDDAIVIRFHRVGGNVTVSYEGRRLSTATLAFLSGTKSFVHRFATELVQRVSEPFTWGELWRLEAYAEPTTKLRDS